MKVLVINTNNDLPEVFSAATSSVLTCDVLHYLSYAEWEKDGQDAAARACDFAELPKSWPSYIARSVQVIVSNMGLAPEQKINEPKLLVFVESHWTSHQKLFHIISSICSNKKWKNFSQQYGVITCVYTISARTIGTESESRLVSLVDCGIDLFQDARKRPESDIEEATLLRAAVKRRYELLWRQRTWSRNSFLLNTIIVLGTFFGFGVTQEFAKLLVDYLVGVKPGN